MRNRVLQILRNKNGQYVSGEDISKTVGITRAAIWKHISELRKYGYAIESSPKIGYKLIQSKNVLNSFELEETLRDISFVKDIVYFDSIDSTNNEAKRIANGGCLEGTVVISGSQTAGKGRMGRTWLSPNGTGVWMSVVLRPDLPPHKIQLLTLLVSCAVFDAIKQLGIDAGIKWPNDIILDGKKVCGILLEMNSEADKINYICAGIGINVSQSENDFDTDISKTAISLRMHCKKHNIIIDDIGRCDIIKSVLVKLSDYYDAFKKGKYEFILNEWKNRNITIGKQVRVIHNGKECEGTAVDINLNGSLLVKLNNGETSAVSSGDVSIRGIMGYSV